MKKYLFSALAMGLVLTSCQSDEPFAPVEGGEKQVTFTLNVPGELGTRAGATDNESDKGGFSNGQGTLYYTLVLDANGDTRVFKDATVSNDGRTATFTPTVVLGRNYTITAYASFDDNASIDDKEDIEAIEVSKNFNDESKDAYFQTITHNFAEGDLQPLTLTRPFGKLRLVATDYKATGNGNTAIKSVKVKYNNNVFTTFNAVSGEFSNGQSYEYTLEGADYSTSYYAPEKDENDNVTGQTIFADYVPVNETGYAPFTVTVEYANGETYTREFNQDIPVKRNALTTLKGNFFTAGAEITVTVDDAFDNDSEEYDLIFTAKELQDAINAATGEATLYLGADITGDVTVIQKPGVKITINGNTTRSNVSYNGTIKVHSNSNHYADAALTIKNINFVTSTASHNFIEALENGSERYSTNITVDNCTFTATGAAENTAVGVQIKSSKWAKVINCTATNMHSLIQAQSCDESVFVQKCKVNGKNGVAFKQVKNAVVEECEITATAYGIRFDGNTDNYGINVKNNKVTAVQPFIVRKMTGKNNTITLEGENTLTTTATPAYQIVITKDSDDAEYVKPTGTYTLTGADNYNVYPRDYYYPVATWAEFTDALAANEPKIKLTDNIEYSGNYSLQKDVVIDLNGKSITMPMFYVFSTATIMNGTINGKMYARTGCKATLEGLTFSGTISDDLSTEGHLQVQGSCDVYAKNCTFAATTVNGSQTRSLSIEASSSGIRKFEGCDFKFVSFGNGAGKYKKNVYINTMNGTTTVDFTDCKFNGKAPNILFVGTYSLKNLTMSGCDNTAPTLEINRAKDTVTEEEWAHISSLIANNKFTQVRVFYSSTSSEYIKQ